jgi:ribonuclease R
MKPNARKKIKKKIVQKVLDVFIKDRSQVMNYKQVASKLKEKDPLVRLMITESLRELTDSGKLREADRGSYRLAEVSTSGIEGTIDISRKGRIFFCSDDLPEDLIVKPSNSIHLLKGDKVLGRIDKKGKTETAVIYDLLHREERFYSGIIEVTKNYAFLKADDPFMPVDIFIPEGRMSGAKDGQKVAVKIIDWPETAASPFGAVMKVIGEPGVPDTEMQSILFEFGLPADFPEEVSEEASLIPLDIPAKEIKKRRDLRRVCTFTIDPEDAKDFDDAISIEPLKGGGWRIGVHIADVSHYVRPGTKLDDEAVKRATSVYLADRVVPMLPEILSNVLCSLRPKEDKLTFSVIFDIDGEDNIKDYWIGRTVTHSDHRFTYEGAQEVIETSEGPYKDELATLNRLAKLYRVDRMKSGAFEFNSPEIRFRYDEKGHPVEAFKKEMKDSNQLVEEFMLLANKHVARYVGKLSPKPPFIYRNHDSPDTEKLMSLRGFVAGLGLKFDPLNHEPREAIKDLLEKAKGKAEEPLIQQMVIRSMAKADYGARNIGHYGLAFDDYSHFTSPIRRYPDVIAHRLLELYLHNQKGISEAEVEVKARHCSLQERKAVEAERASNKYMQALYISNHIGGTFDGKISGLASFGLFVIIDGNYCEGMVSLRTMDDDHYNYRKEDNVIHGGRSGKEFRLGDRVKVKVVRADALSRQIDLVLL